MRKLLTALPDGGVSALSGLQDAQTVGRISVAPSGRKFLLLTIVLFLITFATHAQVVDTWRFDNPQQQGKSAVYCRSTALSAVSEPEFAGIQCARGGQYAPSGLQHGGRR